MFPMGSLMHLKSLALSLLVAGGLATASHAEVITYTISGTVGGGLITGSLDFDNGTVMNIDITTSGAVGNHYTSGEYFNFEGHQRFDFIDGDHELIMSTGSPSLDLSLNDWYTEEYYTDVSRFGTAAFATAGAVVPLPATLPLAASAFAGLGGLGWLNRRRDSADIATAA